jgi:acid phosphatase family membrane protein YuiD
VSSTDNQPSGRAALVEALHVRQNLKRGVVVGVVFTAAIFLFFVVLAPNTVRSPLYYVALAFVLAMASSGLAAAILVMHRAYRLTKEL